MTKMLKIGEMAKFCGVSPRALRVYQEAGILTPDLVDAETGYRAYSVEQSVKVDMVSQLQSAGFTLREIARIEAEKDVDALSRMAHERSRQIEAQIAQLRSEKRASDEIAQGCEQYLGRTLCGAVLTERVPRRHIIVLDVPTWEDLGADGDYSDNERWEFFQQYTKRRLAELGYPPALFRNVGCYVAADIVAPDISLLLSQPFVFVDESFGPEVLERACVLPGGLCLTAYYDDCHAEDGSDLDAARLGSLFAYMDEHGLEPAGPLTMENIFRFMRLFNQDAHAYFRYCLSVKPAIEK